MFSKGAIGNGYMYAWMELRFAVRTRYAIAGCLLNLQVPHLVDDIEIIIEKAFSLIESLRCNGA